MIRALLLSLCLVLGSLVPGSAEDATATLLDEAQATLDQVDAELKNDLNDAALAGLRSRIDPLQTRLGDKVVELQGLREAADRRLAEIAPPAGEDAPSEPAELARQRADETAARQAIEADERRARLLLVRAEQAAQTTTDRRRALFTARIFDQSRSILDPNLWIDGGSALGVGVRRFQWALNGAIDASVKGGALRRATLPLLAAVAVLLAAWPLRRLLLLLAFRFVHWRTQDPKLRRSALGLATTLVTVLVPTGAALLVGLALQSAELLPGILGQLALHLLGAVAFVALAHGLAVGLLEPDRPALRLVRLSDATALALRWYPLLVVLIFTAGKFIDTAAGAFQVPLSGTILSSAVFTLAAAMALAAALKAVTPEEPGGGDSARLTSGLLRLVTWGIVGSALAALALGYVQLAAFLIDQLVWAAMVGAVLFLLLELVDDQLMAWSRPAGLFGRFATTTVGVRGSALERVAIVASGAIRALLIVVAALLVLAPWGVQSSNVISALRAAAFGFEVGGLRISLGQLFAALLLFLAGYAATKMVQRWLDRRLLPKTDLDTGLRSSIGTGLGYLGVMLAAFAAFAYLGFSLDRITVLAGALSLGIGFGLQSVVNNFVSGIILLAERPIKPGDWVALGSEEGNVERISVRSTEITLFDGSTLIVPNADLITKPVRNVTLRGTAGRVKVDFGIAHGSDPDRVRDIALAAASENAAILPHPRPIVQLMGFRDLGMNFSLICYVRSPREAAGARSDLSFAIVRGLQAADIKIS